MKILGRLSHWKDVILDFYICIVKISYSHQISWYKDENSVVKWLETIFCNRFFFQRNYFFYEINWQPSSCAIFIHALNVYLMRLPIRKIVGDEIIICRFAIFKISNIHLRRNVLGWNTNAGNLFAFVFPLLT